ncbi:hypothetical protein BH23CHL4_BH23CHL4_28160 [soil metagenome]
MPTGRERNRGSAASRQSSASQRPVFSERVRALAQTVVYQITGIEPANRELIPTVWTRWSTAGDEKVCPVCGPYRGRTWPAGEGPSPPLHPNCRCSREYAFTTWQVRSL